MQFVKRNTIDQFIEMLSNNFSRPGRVFLIGETSLVFQGWRPWSEHLEFSAEVAEPDNAAFSIDIDSIRQDIGVKILQEHPGDLIPLPDGHYERSIRIDFGSEGGARQIPENGRLEFYHFDPYSVAFRYLARGDEQDYHLAISYLEHGWITLDKMETILTELLPRFSFQTIQQDPAEFRRKYKGLMQMWGARISSF